VKAAAVVAIIGGGPIGLEAAVAAAERGLSFRLYEASPQPGGNVRAWSRVRTFTPWSMNVSPRLARALARAGERAPGGGGLPTGAELARELLDPVASLPAVAAGLRLGTRVLAVGREGLLKHEEIGSARRAQRPFRLLVRSSGGTEEIEHADAVIDCSGTYGNPNNLGDGGIPAPGERAFEGRIVRHLPSFSDAPGEWAGRTVLLTGAGHSAQTAARELAELARHAPATRVVWAIRSADPGWGAVEGDRLAERARLVACARQLARGASPAVQARLGAVTERLAGRDGRVVATLRTGGVEDVEVDRVLALNGGMGDASLYRQLQVHECYATGGPMRLAAALLAEGGADCLEQARHGADALVNPEPGFFILGAKSYGRRSQFLLRAGWQQVDDVFGLLDPR
jgi:cation diffusion facilitator CzcD-associated flavoprotein CzcO